MGLFDFLKKSTKSDVELYYEKRNKRTENQTLNNTQYNYNVPVVTPSFAFRITVEDVFTITGRGTVIVGRVESGSVRVGDTVTLQRTNGFTRDVVVVGIEKFRKMLNVAQAGENVGILLKNLSKADISKGDILTK